MFSRSVVLFAGLLVAAMPDSRALDFQLQSNVVEDDGFKHEQWFFGNDEKTNVLVDLPANWDRRAEAGSLTLTAPGETGSTVRLERSAFTPDTPFKDKGLEAYRRQALATVPQGATEMQMAAEHDEPLPIFHWKSYEFVVDYVFFGRAFRRSVVFVDLNAREQIVATTVAPKAVYDRAHGVAFDLLRSWQVMPKG